MQNKINEISHKRENRISELIQHRQMRPWLYPDLIWKLSPSGKEEKRCLKILHDFTSTVIQEKKMDRKISKSTNDDSNSSMNEANDLYLSSKLIRIPILLRIQICNLL